MILHVDGYLCALKDAQIRGGLHVLGTAPADAALVDVVLAITRLPQGGVPSLRATVAAELGVDLLTAGRVDSTASRRRAASCVERLAATGWDPTSTTDPTLRWVAGRLVPDLRRCGDEITNLLAGLAGRHVPAGPSGAPSRGAAHVLPTGRNFYSVDPKAIPSRLSWEVGAALADRVVERHLAETGTYPTTVGLVLWGTAAMRTHGDDVAEALALLGVRPTWDEQTQRVTGLEVVPLAELGRPRIDVTLRISGFFRDAFPHLVALLDDAVALVAALDEPAEQNSIAAAGARRRPPLGAAARRLRLGHPAAHRAALVALRRRPRRGLPGVVRLRLRPRRPRRGRAGGDAPALRRHRGGGQEPGQPRARHLRLRRLPPGPRRHDRHRPRAHRPRAEGVVRRLGRPGRPEGPVARRGGGPGRAHPRPEPALDRGHAHATATRAPSRWPPPSTTSSATTPPPTSSRTGCTSGSPRPTSPTRRCGSSSSSRTRGRCGRSPSACSRPPSAGCGRPATPPAAR